MRLKLHASIRNKGEKDPETVKLSVSGPDDETTELRFPADSIGFDGVKVGDTIVIEIHGPGKSEKKKRDR